MKGLDIIKFFSIKIGNLFLVYNTYLNDVLFLVHTGIKYKKK